MPNLGGQRLNKEPLRCPQPLPDAGGQRRGSGNILRRESLLSENANHRRPINDAPCAGGERDENTFNALHHSQVIDRAPTEIFLHDKNGLLFITGIPRADRMRDWIHNITADPQVVVHLKQHITVDIPAIARVMTDADERRPLMAAGAQR